MLSGQRDLSSTELSGDDARPACDEEARVPKVVYVTCPECKKEFYVGTEFFEIEESYCSCPFCSKEFKPQPSQTDKSAAHIW